MAAWYREPIRALVGVALTSLWDLLLSPYFQIPAIRPAVMILRKRRIKNAVILVSSYGNLVSYGLVQNSWSVVIGFEMRPLFVLCLMQSKGVWQYIMYNTCISIRFTFSTPCHCFWSALTTMLAQTKKNCLWMRSPTSLSNAQLVRQLKWLTLKECEGLIWNWPCWCDGGSVRKMFSIIVRIYNSKGSSPQKYFIA